MKRILSTLFIPLLFLGLIVKAQSPFQTQLSIPIYFNGVAKKVSNTEKLTPDAFLSGIALMFLDTSDTSDELLMSGNSDLVIWHDKVGKSSLLTLVAPESQAIGKLELLYFDAKCTVNIWRQDRSTGELIQAVGSLETHGKEYSLHFSVDNKAVGTRFNDVINAINIHLMELHTRKMRKAAVKSWYNKDSINVIVGKDYQFNTDNELFWLDQSFRDRIVTVASNDYSKLFLLDKGLMTIQDSIKSGDGHVYHEAKLLPSSQGQGVQGTIAITLKPENISNYMFFNPRHTYRLYVDYIFKYGSNSKNELVINRLGLRNKDNGDFVDMELFDFVNHGLPIMYVDLIIGVVTDSYFSWDISNAIHFIEDVFKAFAMPYE